MSIATIARGVLFDGDGDTVTAYYPGDTISTLSDVDIARLTVCGVLVNPAFQVVFFDGGPVQIIVPTS